MLQIHKYDPSYITLFQIERGKIARILGDACLIEHIGSTAIPGVDGKGIIDVLLIFNKTDEIMAAAKLLRENGYFLSTSKIDRDGRVFMTSSGESESRPGDIHLHLVSKDNNNYQQTILFRDYLIRHSETKQSYIDLKYELVNKVAGDRTKYTKSKSDFINKIVALSRSENTKAAQVSKK